MEYFKKFKHNSGSADAGAESVRAYEWWNIRNRNDEINQDIFKYSTSLKNHLEN